MSENTNGKHDGEKEERVPVLVADEKILPRLNTLATHFTTKYNVKPSFFVRVPGRVNLIGEHIDYCGYPVCPMAIERDILVAVALTEKKELRVTNLDPKYDDFQCDLNDVGVCIEHDGGPAWYKYFLCGVKGALEVIPQESASRGILAAVWGNIPPNSGLASSSALVSAAVLLTVHASQCQLSKHELATISATAERYIGTQGGGMDQAIAFLGKAGSAKFIEFNPLRATDITLPENTVIVIAHSQIYHNKSATADFNIRVAECRLAAQMIAKNRDKDWKSVKRLIDVQELLGVSVDEMAYIATELHPEPYTLDEISKSLGTTIDRLREISLIDPSIPDWEKLKLRQRAVHVFQEASRVMEFRRVTEEDGIAEKKLRELGGLMKKSHDSLTTLYECSHPNLDDFADAARCHGALGARMTGAGWGGCIVAITTKDKVSEFVGAMREEVSHRRIDPGPKLDDLVFPTEANQGAAIYTT